MSMRRIGPVVNPGRQAAFSETLRLSFQKFGSVSGNYLLTRRGSDQSRGREGAVASEYEDAFRKRAYQANNQSWNQYTISSDEPEFV